jgi:hypothetical protein
MRSQVYITTTWPVIESNDKTELQRLYIAGIVCCNNRIVDLPQISTHKYLSPEQANRSLKDLFVCRYFLPFIFPFQLNPGKQSEHEYDSLLKQAVRLLLGWVITKRQKTTHVSIYMDSICGHPPDGNQSFNFTGLLNELQYRYKNWVLDTVRWEDNQFGYMPYAGLVLDLALAFDFPGKSRWVKDQIDYKSFPGYVPFSLDLVLCLGRIEQLESRANLQDVIDIALMTDKSKFGQMVLNDIALQIENRPDLQLGLLETIEGFYENKVRDLSRLRKVFIAVHRLMPALPPEAGARMRIMWYLIALQDANHDGDPERIRKTAATYTTERKILKHSDLELCSYTDLNLAVHYADMFEFANAEVTVGDWIYDPLFRSLSPHQRGKMYSALGQYRSMQSDILSADLLFTKALRFFDNANLNDMQHAGEYDQTSIYRAINALGGNLPDARKLIEAVLGTLNETTARQFAFDGSIELQYRHHLLLRAFLGLDEEIKNACAAYLSYCENWQQGAAQHPWPLIHMYRGLLLWQYGDHPDAALEWFGKAIACCDLETHGATILETA